MLDSAYIYAQIPVDVRPFFKIVMPDVKPQYAPLLDNIAQAILTITRFARLNKTVTLVIGSNPLEPTVPNATLSVTILPPALHISIENLIFLNLYSLLAIPAPLQRACVLEELAHSLMNVADEHLVSVMVAEMLPDVEYRNGQYVML